jgi:hypothetical protein
MLFGMLITYEASSFLRDLCVHSRCGLSAKKVNANHNPNTIIYNHAFTHSFERIS